MAKSAAQLRRMKKRAEARGEEYSPPPPSQKETNESESSNNNDTHTDETRSAVQTTHKSNTQQIMATAAKNFENELSKLESNEDNLNAKQRRSAKRKAEAIAKETSGCESIEELLKWYEEEGRALQDDHDGDGKELNELEHEKHSSDNTTTTTTTTMTKKNKRNPCILFIGQLSYNTTKETLFEYIRQHIDGDMDTKNDQKEKLITPHTLTIRLMTETLETKKKNKKFKTNYQGEEDSPQALEMETETEIETEAETDDDPTKHKRSRGFAFAEFVNPKTMYECLKLHQTQLDGRRINVYRAASYGGKESRKLRIEERKKDQDDYVSQIIQKILEEYITRGDIAQDEFDEGVIKLCQRRSAAVVDAALQQYVEQKPNRSDDGRELENPSAYLTKIICRISEEGITSHKHSSSDRGNLGGRSGRGRGRGRDGGRGGRGRGREGRGRRDDSRNHREREPHPAGVTGVFGSKKDIMKTEQRGRGSGSLTQIFPSMSTGGRGRGRGMYMR